MKQENYFEKMTLNLSRVEYQIAINISFNRALTMTSLICMSDSWRLTKKA